MPRSHNHIGLEALAESAARVSRLLSQVPNSSRAREGLPGAAHHRITGERKDHLNPTPRRPASPVQASGCLDRPLSLICIIESERRSTRDEAVFEESISLTRRVVRVIPGILPRSFPEIFPICLKKNSTTPGKEVDHTRIKFLLGTGRSGRPSMERPPAVSHSTDRQVLPPSVTAFISYEPGVIDRRTPLSPIGDASVP